MMTTMMTTTTMIMTTATMISDDDDDGEDDDDDDDDDDDYYRSSSARRIGIWHPRRGWMKPTAGIGWLPPQMQAQTPLTLRSPATGLGVCGCDLLLLQIFRGL